jgi:hypothetical protein
MSSSSTFGTRPGATNPAIPQSPSARQASAAGAAGQGARGPRAGCLGGAGVLSVAGPAVAAALAYGQVGHGRRLAGDSLRPSSPGERRAGVGVVFTGVSAETERVIEFFLAPEEADGVRGVVRFMLEGDALHPVCLNGGR